MAQGNKVPFLGRWKFPWVPYESTAGQGLIAGAVETFREKTGIAALVEGLVGLYETPWGKDSSLLLVLLYGVYQSGDLKFNQSDFADLRWFTADEFGKLADRDLYSPAMRTVFRDVLRRQFLPLSTIHLVDLLKGTLVS